MIIVPSLFFPTLQFSQFQPTRPGFHFAAFLDVMAHIDCHLARLSNHLADRSPGTSVAFLDGVNWSRKTHSSCGQYQSCGPGSQAEWKAENKLSTGSISPCFLTVYAMWPAAPAPAATSALTWWALPSNCEPTKQNRSHFNTMRKLTNALGMYREENIRDCYHTWSLGKMSVTVIEL